MNSNVRSDTEIDIIPWTHEIACTEPRFLQVSGCHVTLVVLAYLITIFYLSPPFSMPIITFDIRYAETLPSFLSASLAVNC